MTGALQASKKKKKVALFLAYIGAGYSHNPGQKTIEGTVMDALHKAGAVTDDNAGDFSKVSWSRAARTDKGVSAVGNVVSVKLKLDQADLVAHVNKALPPRLRLLGYTRVTGGFDARRACDKRRYEYVLPAFCFAPAEPAPSADGVCAEQQADTSQAAENDEGCVDGEKSANRGAEGHQGSSGAAAKKVQFDEGRRAALDVLLRQYEGTHNFHNFTVRVSAADPSAKRYILSFACAGTLQLEGETWVRMVVTGQSFMMHQIRKMVGTAVAVMRGVAAADAIAYALDPARIVGTPMAPELGLFLDEAIFDSYNRQWGAARNQSMSLDRHAPAVAAFKEEWLYPHIAETDRDAGVNAAWLHTLTEETYKFTAWVDAAANPVRSAAKNGGFDESSKTSERGGRSLTGHKRQQREAPDSRPELDAVVQASLDAEYSD